MRKRKFSSISWEAVRLSPIHFSSRAVTIGFPGAGNVLANAICNRLLERAAIPDSFGIGDGGSEEERLAKNAVLAAFDSRYNAMLSLLRSVAPEGAQSFLQMGKSGACNFWVLLGGGHFLIVTNIELGIYLNARVHTTHELPLAETWEFYQSKDFKTILTIRHPLAVIASFASKSDTDDELVRREAEAMGVSRARLVRVKRLVRPDWIRRTAYLLNEYYRVVLDQGAPFPVVRFEDALLHPVKYVKWLAEQLCVSVSCRSSETISKVIGTTPLASDHFNNPTIDGWRGYFTKADLEVIEDTGLFATFERFGYPRPDAADLMPPSDDERRLRSALAGQGRPDKLSDFGWDFRALIGTFDSGELAAALGAADSLHTCHVGEFQMVASDKQVMSEFAARLAAKAVQHLVESAQIGWTPRLGDWFAGGAKDIDRS